MSEEIAKMPEAPEPPPIIKYIVWGWHHTRKHREALMKPPVLVADLLIGLGVYWLASSYYGNELRMKDERIAQKDERIAFGNEQIAAYRDRLQGASPDQAAKQFATLQSRLESSESKLQMLVPDKLRRLTDREKELLLSKKDDFAILQPLLFVYGWNLGDSLAYANDFIKLFNEQKVPTFGPVPVQCDGSERGVIVGLKNPDKPSEKANKFMSVLSFAGFKISNTKWYAPEQPDTLDFDLFICPP